MTVLTLGAAACNCAAEFIESKLPVHDPEAAQRICDALRECAENYGRTRVHIELEPDESTFIEGGDAANRAELRLVPPTADALRARYGFDPAERFAALSRSELEVALASANEVTAQLERRAEPADLALVLELAERFLAEGEPLPGLKQIAAVDAIARLKGN